MSKTPDDVLRKHYDQMRSDHPEHNYTAFDDNQVENAYIFEAMNAYADQRVSEALNSQWVSVKERLPEDRELVVVFMLYGTNDFSRWTGYRLNGEWMDCNGQLKLKSVTHWTNLPSPPLNH